MNTQIQAYIEQDTEKVADLIATYPQNIPVHALAKFLHCTQESVRSMLETTNSFGIAWRQAGSVNRGFLVPTAVFVRWYLRMM